MDRERIEKQTVAKCFQDQDRTFDEWIVPREISVVPNPLAGQSRGVDEDCHSSEKEGAKPVAVPHTAEENLQPMRPVWPNEWDWLEH